MTLERGTPESVAWSPDGRQIAVVMSSDQNRVLQIYPAFFGGASLNTIALPAEFSRARLLRWLDRDIYAEAFETKARVLRLIAVRLDAGPRIETVSAAWPSPESVRAIDVAPHARTVALVRIVDGREDLWTSDLSGASLRRLTDDAFFERTPIWDGTGSRIIFQSNRGGQLDLWEIDPATGRADVLTSGEMEKIPESTSADGRVISFHRLSQDAKLWRWDARTGDARQLTLDALSDHSPSSSASGSVLAFQRSQPTPSRGYTLLDAKLHVASLDAAGAVRDVRTFGDGFGADVSPDGSWIAYLQATGNATEVAIVLRNLSTGAGQTLAHAAPLPALSLNPVDWVTTTTGWSAAGDLWFVDSARAPAIRRMTPGVMTEPELVADLGDQALVRDLWPSVDGRRAAWLVATRGNPGISLVVAGVAVAGQPRQIARFDASYTGIALRGWIEGHLVVVRRVALHDDFTADLEVTLVDVATGATRSAGAISRGYIATTRLDPARRVLYVTRAEQGAHNLYEFSMGSGAIRALTRNTLPGVTFSGFVPLKSGSVIGVREERRQDLWLIQPAPPAAGNAAGR
jgi:Tol biopolymer transport system component